jgi:hypothetical protein
MVLSQNNHSISSETVSVLTGDTGDPKSFTFPAWPVRNAGNRRQGKIVLFLS